MNQLLIIIIIFFVFYCFYFKLYKGQANKYHNVSLNIFHKKKEYTQKRWKKREKGGR